MARRWTLAVAIGFSLVAATALITTDNVPRPIAAVLGGSKPLPPPPPMRLGINLFGLANFNRQQVFTNLIAQTEWFESRGDGWKAMPPGQLDARGWVTRLLPGQTAPRPLILPPAPFGPATIRCTFAGKGTLAVEGIVRERSRNDASLTFDLMPTGAAEEGAWLTLVRTDPADPLRDIDCRDTARPRTERFHPELLAFLRGFKVIRFLDWQRTNDNAPAIWARRAVPQDSTQASAVGASIEDMVDLANLTGSDPWFLMPYEADRAHIAAFARLVHDRLDPARTVYVELGNEVWNDMFPAAQKARREGLAMALGGGDATRAQMERYADKTRTAMQVWTTAFADRPDRLVRVASTQNAWPDTASMVLEYQDLPRWIDALATAPYVWLDMGGMQAGDLDRIFARMPAEIEATFAFAERNRAIAARYGKRFIAYEGGQHLVTPDIALAQAIQRDPRMADVYRQYLTAWRDRLGDSLTLYASTAPIADYGSWGLREYAGQPAGETPKLRAVRAFQQGLR